jgi:hypothetical protein
MPSLRHCSGGPPPSAIHGRGRLPRHPCRGAPCATPAFGLWERGKQIKIQSESQINSSRYPLIVPTRNDQLAYSFCSSPLNRPSVSSPELLILMHRPIERPSGGSAQWATRHGCRVSRPRPRVCKSRPKYRLRVAQPTPDGLITLKASFVTPARSQGRQQRFYSSSIG